jgi:hypothetical protein
VLPMHASALGLYAWKRCWEFTLAFYGRF